MQEHFWNQQTNLLQLSLQIVPGGDFLHDIQFVVGLGENVQMDLHGSKAYEARGFTYDAVWDLVVKPFPKR